MTKSQDSSTPAPTPAPPPAGKKKRAWGPIIVAALIILSLAWYLAADRLTPYTSQARVQAFVVPVPAEVSGTVLKVYVKNNDEVKPGQPLFDIDPSQYQINLQRSRSDYESVRLSVAGANAAVVAARASVRSTGCRRRSLRASPHRSRRAMPGSRTSCPCRLSTSSSSRSRKW